MRLPLHLLAAMAMATAACDTTSVAAVDLAVPDLGALPDLTVADAGPSIFAELTMTGCTTLSLSGEHPRCTGIAPLTLTLVPLQPDGVTAWAWTAPGAVPESSKSASPTVTYRVPGEYVLTLVVDGAGGAATADGVIDVQPAPVGASCDADTQCAPGYSCLCGDSTDGGVSCPSVLSAGLCTRVCDRMPCGSSENCMNLSRSRAGMPSDDAWRQALCLPRCSTSADCPAGLACRELPVLPPGGSAGGPFTWRRSCWAPLLGDTGAACADASGKASSTKCVTGECAQLGARGLCSLACSTATCPTSAVCATFTGSPPRALCIPRCDKTHPCADPLLDCQAANATGTWGFAVPKSEPAAATYCAPKRCTKGSDCSPAGLCDTPPGISGFCARTW